MSGIELNRLALPGRTESVTLSVPIGHVRVVVAPQRHVARALADAITGYTPGAAGVDITGPAGGRVRLVAGDGALLPHLTVLENIISMDRRQRAEASRDVRATAVTFGLDNLLDRYPHEILAGRRRMAGLARALWAHPDAIVLEDDSRYPPWSGLLVEPWRGYRSRPSGPADHQVPALLRGVATVLIVPTRDRGRAFDSAPLVLDCGERHDQ